MNAHLTEPTLCEAFWQTATLNQRFIKPNEWSPFFLDSNSLEYYFWHFVKEKVWKGVFEKPFKTDKELKKKMRLVWKYCASKTEEAKMTFKPVKPFRSRLQTVIGKHGYSIKTVYGWKFCKILSFRILNIALKSNFNMSFYFNSI